MINNIPLAVKVRHALRDKLTKVGVAYVVIIGTGICAFIAAKRSVDRNRVEVMRSKRRIKQARNEDNEEYFRRKEESEQANKPVS